MLPRARQASIALTLLVGVIIPFSALTEYDGIHLGKGLLKEVTQAPCVRLFSSQGTVGCRTRSREGATAPLYYLSGFGEDDQHEYMNLEEGVAVVMPASMLNSTVLEFLKAQSPARTRGVIVLEESKDMAADFERDSVSPDVSTPQGDGTPSAAFTVGPDHAWNPRGSGLLNQKHDFPVVLASVDGDSTGVGAAQVKAWAQHNGGLRRAGPLPRYKAKFDFYFGPDSPSTRAESDLTSADCLSWRDVAGNPAPQCLPIGGQSVWGTFGGRTGLQTKPSVLLTTAMDGLSFFHERTPAANEAVASILTLLAATSALKNASRAGALDLDAAPYNLAVAFFQADEWGFAGSRRFARDISPGGVDCPATVPDNSSRDGSGACVGSDGVYPSMAFKDLAEKGFVHVLAVDQVGVLGTGGQAGSLPLTALYDKTPPTAVLDAIDRAAASMAPSQAVMVTSLDGSGALPPSPFTSFARGTPALSGAILTGYGETFIDPRYHSHEDTAAVLDPTALSSVAALVARAFWKLAAGPGEGAASAAELEAIGVEPAFVSDLLDCLTRDWDCPAMKAFRDSEISNLKDYLQMSYLYTPPVPRPPTYYAGVLAPYQGLPLVQHLDKSSHAEGVDTGIYAAWPAGQVFPVGAHDKAYVVPKPLEAFLRAWLGHTLGQGGEDAPVACQGPSDCSDLTCDAGLSTRECVLDACVCRTAAFYHTALDPGLAPLPEPGLFAVSDPAAPNWAEPNWEDIGLAVFPDAGSRMEATALGVGVGVAALSVVGALVLQRSLIKHHYFD
ncbi:nicastrin [Nannochloropsis gaditana]|uniref:Nicastrin n=2 Tax=Nannochloropsis gaditana TaxID=72520 RepID=W7TKJ7_9STRA|nr:nicastrin [Nannochloropsis gaditana]